MQRPNRGFALALACLRPRLVPRQAIVPARHIFFHLTFALFVTSLCLFRLQAGQPTDLAHSG